jgi:hypothetical protein
VGDFELIQIDSEIGSISDWIAIEIDFDFCQPWPIINQCSHGQACDKPSLRRHPQNNMGIKTIPSTADLIHLKNSVFNNTNL